MSAAITDKDRVDLMEIVLGSSCFLDRDSDLYEIRVAKDGDQVVFYGRTHRKAVDAAIRAIRRWKRQGLY